MHDKEVLATNKVTVTGGNTDGKHLFMQIDVFDGEHTNRFLPVFDFNISTNELNNYLKSLVDHSTKLPDEIAGMMGMSVWYDSKEESYIVKPDGGEEARQKDGVFKTRAKESHEKATAHR